MKEFKMINKTHLCECGCGEEAKPGNRFINHHNRRGIPNPKSCKTRVKMSEAKLGITLSPEHCAAMSKAKLGISHSPEHNAAIKKGMEESGIYEAMRGGNDIIMHHWLYDDADLSLYTMPMTRSEHTSMHRRMQLDGYKVPHINSETADNGLWGYR